MDYRYIELQTRLVQLAESMANNLDGNDPEAEYLTCEAEKLADIANDLVSDVQRDEFDSRYLKPPERSN